MVLIALWSRRQASGRFGRFSVRGGRKCWPTTGLFRITMSFVSGPKGVGRFAWSTSIARCGGKRAGSWSLATSPSLPVLIPPRWRRSVKMLTEPGLPQEPSRHGFRCILVGSFPFARTSQLLRRLVDRAASLVQIAPTAVVNRRPPGKGCAPTDNIG
jgi:hypothetical protein